MKIEFDLSKKFLFGLLVVLFVGTAIAYGTSNPSVFGHSVGEIGWDSPIEGQLKINGFETLQGWRNTLSLMSPGNAMILFSASNLGFGSEGNNFYWKDFTGNAYPMYLTRAGKLVIQSGLTVGGKNVCLADGTNCPASGGTSVVGETFSCNLLIDCAAKSGGALTICGPSVPSYCKSGEPCYLKGEYYGSNGLGQTKAGWFLQDSSNHWVLNDAAGLNGDSQYLPLFGDNIGYGIFDDMGGFENNPNAFSVKSTSLDPGSGIKLSACTFS